ANKTTFAKFNISDAKKIICGYNYTFIIKYDNTIWSCGYNGNGQLGFGDNVNKNVFTKVNIENVKDVITSGSFTFLLKNDGSIWVCGLNNSGQLGLGDTNDRNVFTKVDIELKNNLPEYANNYKIKAGRGSYILKNNNALWSCGYNTHGALGLGDTTHRYVFTKVNIDNVKNIACGTHYAFIIKNDNTVWSTGYNNYGQLGLGDNVNKNV
ncbi:TPA: RCC1 domain-containing protein, partial [Clostridioides difficile]